MKKLKFLDSGKKLREARKRAGMNQTEAALKAGISQTYLSALERGEHSARLDQAAMLADAYGIPVESLTGGKELPARDPTAEDLLDKLRQKNKEIASLRAQLAAKNQRKIAENPYSDLIQDLQAAVKALGEKPANALLDRLRTEIKQAREVAEQVQAISKDSSSPAPKKKDSRG